MCRRLEAGDASFLGGTEVGAQYFTPEDFTVVVVTHLRTEDDPAGMKVPPPEPHSLPLPEEKPPLYTPPPTPQLPPMMLPPPTVHTPPPMPLAAPKPPALPPAMVVLPTTAAREREDHCVPRSSLGIPAKRGRNHCARRMHGYLHTLTLDGLSPQSLRREKNIRYQCNTTQLFRSVQLPTCFIEFLFLLMPISNTGTQSL